MGALACIRNDGPLVLEVRLGQKRFILQAGEEIRLNCGVPIDLTPIPEERKPLVPVFED